MVSHVTRGGAIVTILRLEFNFSKTKLDESYMFKERVAVGL